METRSKARAARSQVPPEGVLEDTGPQSPASVDEDLGLASMMGDGEAPIVGEGQPEVRATTSALGDVPVATEWAPAREPAEESARPTLAYASTIANDAAEPAAASLSIPTKAITTIESSVLS